MNRWIEILPMHKLLIRRPMIVTTSAKTDEASMKMADGVLEQVNEAAKAVGFHHNGIIHTPEDEE